MNREESVWVVTTLNKVGDLVNIDVFEDKKDALESCSKINMEGGWETIADFHEQKIIGKKIEADEYPLAMNGLNTTLKETV